MRPITAYQCNLAFESLAKDLQKRFLELADALNNPEEAEKQIMEWLSSDYIRELFRQAYEEALGKEPPEGA